MDPGSFWIIKSCYESPSDDTSRNNHRNARLYHKASWVLMLLNQLAAAKLYTTAGSNAETQATILLDYRDMNL